MPITDLNSDDKKQAFAVGALFASEYMGGLYSGAVGSGHGGLLGTGSIYAVSNAIFKEENRTIYQHTGYPNGGGIHFTPISQLTSFFGCILGEGGCFDVTYGGKSYSLYGGRFKNSAIEIYMGMVDRRDEHKWDEHPDWLWSGGDYMKVVVGGTVKYENLGYNAAFSNWNYTHNSDDTYDHHWAKVNYGNSLLVEKKTSSPGSMDLLKIIPIQDQGYYFYCTGIYNGYVDKNGNSASVKCETKIASATNDATYATKYLNAFIDPAIGEEHQVYKGYFVSNVDEKEIEGVLTPFVSLGNKGIFLIAQDIKSATRQSLIKLLDNLVMVSGDSLLSSEYDNIISNTLIASYQVTEGGE